MSVEVQFFFLLVALVCFVLEAAAVAVPRISLIGLGLAAWVLIPFWSALEGL